MNKISHRSSFVYILKSVQVSFCYSNPSVKYSFFKLLKKLSIVVSVQIIIEMACLKHK